ncbi:MAG: hypothetical protein WBG38_06165 [Nodosilinea sp.]
MHPPLNHFLIAHLAYAVSLGLLITATPLRLATVIQPYAESAPTVRSDDDRGSGRLSRVPAILSELSLRGSGRVNRATPPLGTNWHSVAYRGSGRIT